MKPAPSKPRPSNVFPVTVRTPTFGLRTVHGFALEDSSNAWGMLRHEFHSDGFAGDTDSRRFGEAVKALVDSVRTRHISIKFYIKLVLARPAAELALRSATEHLRRRRGRAGISLQKSSPSPRRRAFCPLRQTR